jgi:hypothetical protein
VSEAVALGESLQGKCGGKAQGKGRDKGAVGRKAVQNRAVI